MANYNQRVSTDKFGNPYQVVGMKDKKGTGFPKGYIELGNKLYKIEVSESKKDDVHAWVRVTEVKKQAQNRRM